MKSLSLLLWVTQFGFSAIFPLCAFLLLGSWLQSTYDLGLWIVAVCGLFGLLTAITTVRSCLRAIRREAGLEQKEEKEQTPVAYNDHE